MQQSGLRFLLPYMQPYRAALARGALYAFIGASASAFSPTLLGWAIDDVLKGVSPTKLGLYALGDCWPCGNAGAVSLPVAHAHRQHRRRGQLSNEHGFVYEHFALRPHGDAAIWHWRPAFARHKRFHLYLALLQRRFSDGDPRTVLDWYRLRADGDHQPAAGRRRHHDGNSKRRCADAARRGAGALVRPCAARDGVAFGVCTGAPERGANIGGLRARRCRRRRLQAAQ